MFCREKLGDNKTCGKQSFTCFRHLAEFTLYMWRIKASPQKEEMAEGLNTAEATFHLQTDSSLFLQMPKCLLSFLLSVTKIP